MAEPAALPLLLEHAIDAVEVALRNADGENLATLALRSALIGATGRARGAARLAGQMRLWYREAPERARLLSHAALAEAVAASMRRAEPA